MLSTGVITMSLRDVFEVKDFHYPVHWVWMSQLGYSLAWIAHHFTKHTDPGNVPSMSGLQKEAGAPQSMYVIAMLLDAMCMVCAYEALGSISAAIVQMMRSAKLVIAFFVTTVVMQKKQLPRQRAGVLIVLLGIFMVVLGILKPGNMPIHSAPRETGGENKWLALLLCFVSELFNAAFYLYQEHTTKKYDLTAFHTVGVMGMYGVVIFSIVLAVLNMVHVENSLGAFDRVTHSWPVAISAIGYILLLSIYEICGVVVSKQGSAILRALIDVTRGALIWAVELHCQWVQFEVLHAIGFAIITCGTLVNTGIIHLNFLDPGPEAKALLRIVN
jgi:drug/metabolite transporter (DMT)-like permease